MNSFNEWADFWRYQIGVNVIPADTKNKSIYEDWKEWQSNPIPEELHNHWKRQNKFSSGLAVILGKVWHNPQKAGLYLNGIDADNLKAIEEICTYNGKILSIKELAKWTLVEQHPDNTNKAHIYIYSKHKPFAKKSSDISKPKLGELIEKNEIPAIEVKGEEGKSTMFCCPSIHEDGYRYQIRETYEPVIADDFEGHIDNICKKYGLIYIWNGSGSNGNGKSSSSSSNLIPIEELFEPDTKILAGHNRHEALLRAMESLISRNKGIMSLDDIKPLASKWNSDHCVPPLDYKDFEKQWKCALEFIAKNNGNANDNGNSKLIDAKAALAEDNDDGNDNDSRQVKAREYTVFKYSQDNIPLAEEINLAGVNKFLQIIDDDTDDGTDSSSTNNKKKKKPVISDKIDLSEEKHIILKPHEQGTGSPIFPYTFANMDEIKIFIDRARKETIDSLFLKHKSIWKKIVVADNEILNLLAIDSLYSYFQDKFSTTHYDMFVGAPNSGKGAILLGFKYLGYRVVIASDMSGANLLDLLGSIESNQITLAEDELDDIHEDPDKLRIYKVGYDNTDAVPRTLEGNTINRNARFYYPFCFKIYAAEESPDVKKLEGFNDRTFKLNTMKGSPKIYVKKLSEKTDSKKYNDVVSKIDYLRKLTLIFRLIHHGDIIEQVSTNIEGRALELTEPQIRLFNSDKLASSDKTVLNKDVLPTLSACLRRRGEIAKKTLDAIVHDALKKLLPKASKKILLNTVIGNNSDGFNDNSHAPKIISNQEIYETVRMLADGTPITGKDGVEHSFYSVEYNEVSEKKILKICRDRFFAKDDTIGRDNGKHRALQFNEDIVSKVGQAFDVISEIKVSPADKDDGSGFGDDDDDELWSGWRSDNDDHCDGSDDGSSTNLSEKSTSESGTQIRKLANMEEKDTLFDGTKEMSSERQNGISSDNINPVTLDSDNLQDLGENIANDGNIATSNGSEKPGNLQPNESKNDQKEVLLPKNNPVCVFPSPNDYKNVIEEYSHECYYCEYKTNNEDHYERHVILRHDHSSAYPNKPEIEKRGLKPQGKSWEI